MSQRDIRVVFLCDVPNTSRTLLFSDKAWVYKGHFLQFSLLDDLEHSACGEALPYFWIRFSLRLRLWHAVSNRVRERKDRQIE